MSIIRDCMKTNIVSVSDRATLKQALTLVVKHHIGTLPVVNDSGTLMGVLELKGFLALVMPDFVEIMDRFDFVHDFGDLEIWKPSEQELEQPVQRFIKPAIFVNENAGLLRAAALLYNHKLLDLPVIDQSGKLVGIASLVDVGTAIMKSWARANRKEPSSGSGGAE